MAKRKGFSSINRKQSETLEAMAINEMTEWALIQKISLTSLIFHTLRHILSALDSPPHGIAEQGKPPENQA